MTTGTTAMTRRLGPVARRVLARAGVLAAGGGRLDDAALLRALAETVAVAALFGDRGPAVRERLRPVRERRDRELLAGLGIDPAEVLARAGRATGVRVDDPHRWRLRRPWLLPLRLRLTGPSGDLVLTEPARKAVEVAVNGAPGRLVDELDLLRGLLADRRTPAVRALAGVGVDVPALARVVFGRG